MFSRIRFYVIKFFVTLNVWLRNLLNQHYYTVEGIHLPIKKQIGFNTLRWILNGKYESGEINILKHRLTKTDRILEIGTGLGFISSYCAKIVGSENVYTFEANPVNFEEAKKTFIKNEVNPQLRNAILAEFDGETEFFINNKSRLASSHLIEGNSKIQLPKVALNDFINKVNPTYLVMDIEGGEYDIFKILSTNSLQKIQFELHPLILGEKKCAQIFDTLDKLGFVREQAISSPPNYFFIKRAEQL
jgi:FkbM family methyltransferase